MWPAKEGFVGSQSVLDPAGSEAILIAELAIVLFWGGAAILVIVIVALVVGLMGPQRWRNMLAREATVQVGGVIVPVVVLSALLVWGSFISRKLTAAPAEPAISVHVAGEQFWWRVRYRGSDPPIETANELHLPAGKPVRLTLTTADVIHSFWVPSLAGKIDMIPGQTNILVLTAERPGVYRGQCAEFCGLAHAQMAFDVIVRTPEDFSRWLEGQSQPAVATASEVASNGAGIFLASGCGGCHTVRGTQAAGRIGPDLTHVGSRRSLAAASLPNAPDTLSRWITASHEVKPGSRMPPFEIFSTSELAALGAYLQSLQ